MSKRLLFHALLFSILLSSHTLYELITTGELLFSGWQKSDETIYLKRPQLAARGLDYLAVYKEQSTAPSAATLLLSHPNRALDMILGYLSEVLHLSPAGLGLLLDLLCIFLSYLACTSFFSLFSSSCAVAELAAALSLSFPYLATFSGYVAFSEDMHLWLRAPDSLYNRAPVVRAAYTQLSIPLFLYAFKWVWLVTDFSKKVFQRHVMLAGVLWGSLVYVYSLGWLAGSLLFTCLVLFRLFTNLSESKFLHRLPRVLLLGAVALLVSLTGIWLMFMNGSREGYFFSEIQSWWYLPFEKITLSLLLLFLSFHKRIDSKMRGLISCVFLVLLAACFGANIQPLLGAFVGAYSFDLFYYTPIATGLLLILLFDPGHSLIATFLTKKTARSISICVAALIYISVVEKQVEKVVQVNNLTVREWPAQSHFDEPAMYYDSPADFKSLVAYLRTHVEQDAVVAVMPVSHYMEGGRRHALLRFHPNLIAFLTDRHILSQGWVTQSASMALDVVKREALSSWLFTGEVAPYFCGSNKIELPGDLYFGTVTFVSLLRQRECERYREESQAIDICSLLEYQVDYVLLERGLRHDTRTWIDIAGEKNWESPGGKYMLFRFNVDKAKDKYCQ